MNNQDTLLINQQVDTQKLPGINALGTGYDVRGKYADPYSLLLDIVDLGPITKKITLFGREFLVPQDVTISIHQSQKSFYETNSGSDIEKYREDLNVNTQLKGKFTFFSGSLSTDFNKSEMSSSSNEFSTVRNVVEFWSMNLPDIATLRLKKTARDDIEGITKMKPIDVLNKYGAYFIWEAIVGGRLDYSSATDKRSYNSEYDFSMAAEMSLQFLIGSISATNKTKYAKSMNTFHQSSSTNVNTVGGDPTLGSKIAFGGEVAYSKWIDSVMQYPVFMNFTSSSLVAISDLCKDPERKKELEAAYVEYMKTEPISMDMELEVRMTSNLVSAGADHGSGSKDSLTVFKPLVSNDYYWLGHLAQGNYYTALKQLAIVKPLSPDCVAPPIGFARIWDDGGSGNKHDYSCWRPIPPVGYVAMGYLMRLKVDDQNPPSGDEIKGLVCVHESLVTDGKVNTNRIWSDRGSGAKEDCSIFEILPKDDLALISNTFYGQRKNYKYNPNPSVPPVKCFIKSKIIMK